MWYVGDVVRVRDDLIVDRTYDEWYFVNEMEKYMGKEFIISEAEIDDDGIEVYHLENTVPCWGFTAPMLELIPQNIDLNDFERMLLDG